MRRIESRETNDSNYDFIVSEAVRLASSCDLNRGYGCVWQAIRNAGIRRRGEQTEMFQRVIGEVKERLEARQLRKDLLKEAGLRDAVLHEAEIDPSVPGDIKNDAA